MIPFTTKRSVDAFNVDVLAVGAHYNVELYNGPDITDIVKSFNGILVNVDPSRLTFLVYDHDSPNYSELFYLNIGLYMSNNNNSITPLIPWRDNLRKEIKNESE